MQKSCLALAVLLATFCSEGTRHGAVMAGDRAVDPRLQRQRTLNDAYHPWTPAATLPEWEQQAAAIRERVLVSTGLWPMPPKAEQNAVIHGKRDRGEYTVEKVFFASHPGHYVTGNLYRPTKKADGKRPGILCPHGHWQNGRFYDAGDNDGRAQIDIGAERDMAGARYPLQARMAQLARMGCVVFHYDMVGNADSRQIGHAAGFRDAEAGARLQNALGLQTFNSICALDFLTSLPDVDPERIGVTGSSGGGTQTFMLCAVDPRPKVAFPAVMVSTAMQGGCVCENAEHLRIGINNVAIAALFAPKPLAMSGADDWTIQIETKGLPELKQVYALYGRADLVHAKAYPQFKHNYNRVAREMMYDWFNTHLSLGYTGPISEEDFWPIDPKELSVFDAEHPLPSDAVPVEGLRKYLTDVARRQFDALLPHNADQAAEYKRVVGTAARVMLDDGAPASNKGDHLVEISGRRLAGGSHLDIGTVSRKSTGERVPFTVLTPPNFSGEVILWIDGEGQRQILGADGTPSDAARRLLDAGHAVASADLFLTGSLVDPDKPDAYPPVNETYQGYTFGYNRTVLANRVRDLLTIVSAVIEPKRGQGTRAVKLVGTGQAGPWVLLAAGIAGERIDETIADARGFRFESVTSTTSPMYLPGALKYGGLCGLTALAAPQKLTVAGMESIPIDERKPLEAMYSATGGALTLQDGALTPEAVVQLLLD